MTAWLRATAFSQAAFASRLFGRSADDPVVQDLHDAALCAATATTHDDLRDASGKLARAMEGVGIDRWPGFVADAQQRARNPATLAALKQGVGAASPAPTGAATGSAPPERPISPGDLERRRQSALSFIQLGGSATSSDTNAMAEHLASVMTFSQLRKMKSVGIHVIVSRNSVTDYLTNLKGVQPRGYPPGWTWDAVPGTVNGNNEVVVATHTGANGERELPGTRQSSSADVTLHEIGHAINRQTGRGWVSDKTLNRPTIKMPGKVRFLSRIATRRTQQQAVMRRSQKAMQNS